MKKHLNKIYIVSIVVIGVILFTANSSTSKEVKEVLTPPTLTDAKEDPLVFIDKYSEKDTKNIYAKLDLLLKRINKRHDFHGSILVAKNDKIVYENQIGFADFRKKTFVNEESVFQLASVSKQFTAAAIMLLYEKGEINLTDTVDMYFPNFPYENVTIKNLLNHTAGLPNYFWIAEHKWNQEKAPINSEMMELLASSDVSRFFKPGRKFDYSNAAYFVLASIVEKVAGISFGSFLEKNVFEPLHMKNSYVYSFENDSIRENQLEGYRLYRGWRHLKIKGTVNDAIVGDKNIYTTAKDLFKWTLELNARKLLTEESLALMYSKGTTNYGKKIPYGFGFRIDTKGPKKIYHYGKWNGFSTSFTKYIEDNLVIIILEHTSYNAMKSLNEKIRKIVVDNFN